MQPCMPILAAASTCATASRVEAAEMVAKALPRAPALAAAMVRQPSTRSSKESVCPSPSEPGHTVPVQPAPSMRCVRSASRVVQIEPSSRNGVTSAGITPRKGAPTWSEAVIEAR